MGLVTDIHHAVVRAAGAGPKTNAGRRCGGRRNRPDPFLSNLPIPTHDCDPAAPLSGPPVKDDTVAIHVQILDLIIVWVFFSFAAGVSYLAAQRTDLDTVCRWGLVFVSATAGFAGLHRLADMVALWLPVAPLQEALLWATALVGVAGAVMTLPLIPRLAVPAKRRPRRAAATSLTEENRRLRAAEAEVMALARDLMRENAELRGTAPRAEAPAPKPAPQPMPVPASAPEGDIPPLRILAVDDNPVNGEVLYHFLTRAGQAPIIVESAEAAIRAVASGGLDAFDVLLIDVVMPGMSGLDLLAVLQDAQGTSDLPAFTVAMTADAADNAPSRYLAAGFDAYLGKPIEPAELHRVLLTAAQRPCPDGPGLTSSLDGPSRRTDVEHDQTSPDGRRQCKQAKPSGAPGPASPGRSPGSATGSAITNAEPVGA